MRGQSSWTVEKLEERYNWLLTVDPERFIGLSYCTNELVSFKVTIKYLDAIPSHMKQRMADLLLLRLVSKGKF